ncbi:MAG: DUF4383 domain-containing protein [Actinomycetota bacterium]
MSLNRKFGYAFGAVYALIGVVGFAITQDVGFFATQGRDLIVFEVNPLHNIIHIAVGALFIGGAAAGAMWSKRVNGLIGGVYMTVGIAGLFLVGTAANILALNHPDNALHFATALLAIAVASYKETSTVSPRMTAQPS